MHLENIWWLEDDDPLNVSDDYGLHDEELGIFGDIVKTVSKVAKAPVNLVAKALPKPVRGIAKVALDPVGLVGRAGLKMGAGMVGPKPPPRRAPAPSPGRAGIHPLIRDPEGLKRTIARIKAGQGAPTPPRPSVKDVARGGWGGQFIRKDSPDETAVKILGAQRILETVKPKVTARSSGAAGSSAQAKLLAAAVGKQLSPQLAQINKRLKLAANQRQATSEHLAINNKKAFRTKVLKDLVRISGCLPADDPARKRIRKVGLMSGLV